MTDCRRYFCMNIFAEIDLRSGCLVCFTHSVHCPGLIFSQSEFVSIGAVTMTMKAATKKL